MQSIGSQASLAEEECASGSVGGVRPCQGRGRGFESRLALFKALDFSRAFLFYRKVRPIRQKTSGELLSASGTRLTTTEVKRRAHFAIKEYGCQSSRVPAREAGWPGSLFFWPC